MAILRGTGPTTLTKTWYVDGDPTDVGTVTVDVEDTDGNSIDTGGATTEPATGVYAYELAVQDEAKELIVTWDAGTQQLVDRLRVTGGWLYTETEIREFYGSDLAAADADFTDAKLAATRDRITAEFERICEVAFVPTFRRETKPGTGSRVLQVQRPLINTIIQATIGGTAQTVADLAHDGELPYIRHKNQLWSSPSTADPYNVTISYVHGHDSVPGDIQRAALILARQQILKDIKGAGIPETASSFTDATGQYVSFAANDQSGRWYGIPAVDTVLRDYSMRIPVWS